LHSPNNIATEKYDSRSKAKVAFYSEVDVNVLCSAKAKTLVASYFIVVFTKKKKSREQKPF